MKKRLYYFSAEHCTSCRAMHKIVEKFEDEHPDISVIHIHSDDNGIWHCEANSETDIHGDRIHYGRIRIRSKSVLQIIEELDIQSAPTFIAVCIDETGANRSKLSRATGMRTMSQLEQMFE